MVFGKYKNLTHQERALLDGKLITYHFYVGGGILLLLGTVGLRGDEAYSWVAVFFGVASIMMGAGLHVLHRRMVHGPQREAYLTTISAAMGRHSFPVLPSLLGLLIAFSLLVTLFYLWTN
jgi:4-hydroxybenzoate polyprenyltransferase